MNKNKLMVYRIKEVVEELKDYQAYALAGKLEEVIDTAEELVQNKTYIKVDPPKDGNWTQCPTCKKRTLLLETLKNGQKYKTCHCIFCGQAIDFSVHKNNKNNRK